MSLREIQKWFAGAITHPGSVQDGVVSAPYARWLAVRGAEDVDAVLTSGPQLSAIERLALYHDAYHARLIECLADDYPALAFALGRESFESLCRRYIVAYPSRSPSLNAFGKHMSEHVRSEGGEHAAFAADLARLEWAIVESIHAEEKEAIAPEALQSVAPERWGRATLPPSGAAHVLHFDYPVNRFYKAFREGEAQGIPAPEKSAVVVYRRSYVVWRMDLTPAMTAVLEALFAGATLEAALAAIARHAEDEDALAEAERSVMMCFRDWVEGGFFARIALEA